MSEVKVTCRRCGKQSPASQFVLHPEYKMVVCQNCVKESRARSNVQAELKAAKAAKQGEEEESKPAGWDEEDEYLFRAAKRKEKEPIPVVQKLDEEHVRYKCQKCSYTFTYNVTTLQPARCPYCSKDVAYFRVL